MRRGEIAPLRWRSVDFQAGNLDIVESAEQTTKGVRYKEPKAKSKRNVRLPETVIAELSLWRRKQTEEIAENCLRPDGDTFVMTQIDGSASQPRFITHE